MKRNSRISRAKKVKKGAPAWMVTYSDMVTLILVFFVLLFSMSQIDAEKFRAISESFRSQRIFDALPAIIHENTAKEAPKEYSETNQDETFPKDDEIVMEDNEEDARDQIEQNDSLDELLREIRAYLQENNLEHVISANRTIEGVVLVLQERVLFETGEAEIIDTAEPFLDKVGELLTSIPNEVRVEGHTDNRPISNYRFPSNWELSAARASSVIRYLLDEGDFVESRFIAAGFGDTRPTAPNDSASNWSKNRRVEMVILEEKDTD
ncbi:chemotaxis protein MotB [Gracilibacillus halotolerans]|uniref:Chemotaxis protein MotB n=1 Tax=Gracilibacillus halotolerans TaxID=74386 RepID=A0A841RQM8_9BACI|nr:flagellar motor protein MotS [Gracilibacillus halotolerans]MBB6513676.1 chemotaxis protein MotB [Gracilibacillus halotolerans]